MKDLIIIGASGHGREVLDIIERINDVKPTYNILGFVDDNEAIQGHSINGIKVLGGLSYLKEFLLNRKIFVVIAIANADIKRKISSELEGIALWTNIIDPTVIVSKYCSIGYGNVIGPYSWIGPNSQIGNFCDCVFACSVGHDVIIEDYVSIMDYCDITGHDYLEAGVYLGSSVAIIPGIRIAQNCILGAGAVVVKDISEQGTYTGIPAKRLK